MPAISSSPPVCSKRTRSASAPPRPSPALATRSSTTGLRSTSVTALSSPTRQWRTTCGSSKRSWTGARETRPNASPLIFLAKIELLPMLRSGFLQVLAPPAVVAETRLVLPGFIECRELSEIGHAFVRGAIGTLHRGRWKPSFWHASRASISLPSTTKPPGVEPVRRA
ncbi:hypothetical protein THIOKS11570028 [Thiocapsa sp. KS1]|nr:hypothetical protein THIOKS11570028 [Thiocapsa sp. KS1]